VGLNEPVTKMSQSLVLRNALPLVLGQA